MRPVSRLMGGLVTALLILLVARPDALASVLVPTWHPPVLPQGLTARPSHVFLFIMDGGLPSYLKLADFPHVAALERSGTTYTRAWDGMLETETPTGHATIGTGSVPKHHGVLSFGWVNDSGAHVVPTNPIPIQQGQLEDLLKRSGVPSIASEVKQNDPHSTIVVTSGHKDYAVDSVGGWAADYLMFYHLVGQTWSPVAIPRHVPPASILQAPGLTAYAPHMAPGDQDSLAIKLAMTAFQRLRQKVTIINLPEFDWPLGHLDGGGADKWFAWKLMTRFDSDLANIEAQLKQDHVLNQTLFVLTADHGMETINHEISHDSIQGAVQSTGNSLAEYEFHTAGYLWLNNPAGSETVAQAILALHNPYIRAVYYRVRNTATYKLAPGPSVDPAVNTAYQWLLDTLAGPGAPHVVIILRENSSIRGRNQTNWKGDHGGPTWNAEHVPLILSGPGVRRSAYSNYPATIYDVAPTILDLLGITPRGMDGIVLDNALSNPSASLAAGQKQRGNQLRPIQDALIAQSKRDGP